MSFLNFMHVQQSKEKSFKKYCRADLEIKQKKYCISKRYRFFEPINFGSFKIKIADTKDEIKSAQHLRYSVFYKEKKRNQI